MLNKIHIDWNLVYTFGIALGIYEAFKQVLISPWVSGLIARNLEYRTITRKTFYFLHNNFHMKNDWSGVSQKEIETTFKYANLVKVTDRHLHHLMHEFLGLYAVYKTLNPDRDLTMHNEYKNKLFYKSGEIMDICNPGRFASIIDLTRVFRNLVFFATQLIDWLKTVFLIKAGYLWKKIKKH